ncbi:transcriptional antiterminator [Candidatus Mycoplasma haematobovis]|uniref:Transcription termination/antitermination protein NusG n=1 Tax=Candidatus Mycoplasma haematobovis TaxID=432608 RepID=A0A1A9QE56_9MOLU|nr:transcription termination/antitermination protein NusG [Candidatus Mycoplasma haematobovis]OAL10281.1 transcriptional antiterminator [Candidatus Mycoplasma haematobovis]
MENQEFSWYTLRTLLDEEKLINSINEFIGHHKLSDRIREVKFFREHKIIESEEFSPSSDLLPKRGFKASKTSAWVKLSNGNYKRLKLVEKRPFKGMIFINMDYDFDLFKLSKFWDANSFFLGAPNPAPISSFQLKKTEDSLDKSIPSIKEYAESKGYMLVEGSVSSFKDVKVEGVKGEEPVEEVGEAILENKYVPTEQEILEAKKAEIYSDLKIKEYEDNFDIVPRSKGKSKKNENKFKVNDFVFISKLGFKGVIQEIDYEKDIVVVGVQMFGRRQPVSCKISEISEI